MNRDEINQFFYFIFSNLVLSPIYFGIFMNNLFVKIIASIFVIITSFFMVQDIEKSNTQPSFQEDDELNNGGKS